MKARRASADDDPRVDALPVLPEGGLAEDLEGFRDLSPQLQTGALEHGGHGPGQAVVGRKQGQRLAGLGQGGVALPPPVADLRTHGGDLSPQGRLVGEGLLSKVEQFLGAVAVTKHVRPVRPLVGQPGVDQHQRRGREWTTSSPSRCTHRSSARQRSRSRASRRFSSTMSAG